MLKCSRHTTFLLVQPVLQLHIPVHDAKTSSLLNEGLQTKICRRTSNQDSSLAQTLDCCRSARKLARSPQILKYGAVPTGLRAMQISWSRHKAPMRKKLVDEEYRAAAKMRRLRRTTLRTTLAELRTLLWNPLTTTRTTLLTRLFAR